MRKRCILSGCLSAVLCLCAQAALGSPDPMTRDEIVDLAKTGVDYSYWWGHDQWRRDGTQHGSCSGSCPDCTHTGSYGADCSGYVGKVWQVPSPIALTTYSHPYSTREFRYQSYHWDQVSRDDARKADALVYRNSSNTGGHVILYESGDPWGSSWVYEAKGCSYGIVHNLKSIGSSYVAIRRHQLESAPLVGTIQGVVYQDVGVGSDDMSIRVPGARLSVSSGASLTARENDAYWSFSLSPGDYTITAAADGYRSSSRTCSATAGAETWCSIGVVAECVPDCSGRQCGPDPVCSESCGSCPQGHACSADGRCVCQPDCSGRECGPDPVCGADCGSCPPSMACNPAGVCEGGACVPDCSGRECGPDPVCGQSCGMCPAEAACDLEGRCRSISPSQGKLYGYVMKIEKAGGGFAVTRGRPLQGAEVRVDEYEATADEYGYYELLVAPGEHVVEASHSGCEKGRATCLVAPGGHAECDVPVYGQQPVVEGGCATGGATGHGMLLAIAIPLLVLRRRSGRPD